MELGSDDDVSIDKLNGLLLDAMNQSKALYTQLEERNKTIENLKHENQRLRRDYEALRNGPANTVLGKDVYTQLDHLFQQDTAKQAEIQCLKAELRAARKDRSRQRLKESQLVSPIPSSDGVDYVLASHPPRMSSPAAGTDIPGSSKRAREEPFQPASSPVQKKLRPDLHNTVLQEVVNNALNNETRRRDGKGHDGATRGAKAIPTLTEDGEDHNREENDGSVVETAIEIRRPGVHERLGALLSAAFPASSTGFGPEHWPAKSVSPRTPVQKPPLLTKSSSDVAPPSTAERPRGLRFLRPARHRDHAPEDDEPLRSRPLQRLNLSHFKLNPAYYQQYEPACEGPVRNKEQKKCLSGCTRVECCGSHMRALALALGPDLKLSDDDLLLDFLGPDSERKIATLTSVARENLVHEARVKMVANEGKMHRNGRERAMTPSGFWNTDMPGSQEVEDHREEARQWEREEVEMRHQEACKDEGKWIFADEE